MSSISESNRNDKELIHITHFVNPHHFWFKFIDDNQDDLNDLDARIHAHATHLRKRNQKNMNWNIGDVIAAYHFPWNKWVRCKVENKIEVLEGTPKYYLWAIDYGTPLEVIGMHTTLLPDELANVNIQAVHEGSIYGIMPAEQKFDTISLNATSKTTNVWSKKAIKMCKDIFTAAAHIILDLSGSFNDNQYYFGSLKVVLFNGDIKDVSKCLEDLRVANKADNFVMEIERIKSQNTTIKMQYIEVEHTDNDDTSTQISDSSNDNDSDDELVKATIDWINGKQSLTKKNQFDDHQQVSQTAGTKHQSRLEKLKSQVPRLPRQLKNQSENDVQNSNEFDYASMQHSKQNITNPNGKLQRLMRLNHVPIPSGFESDIHGFVKCQPPSQF